MEQFSDDLKNFMKELDELTNKYQIVIDSCGYDSIISLHELKTKQIKRYFTYDKDKKHYMFEYYDEEDEEYMYWYVEDNKFMKENL